mgnify:CR=1 FL=1
MDVETAKYWLAYAALAYLMGSVLYMLITRACQFGTPLKDSYSLKQQEIKKSSARNRGGAFLLALVISTVILAVAKPLK